MIRKLIKGKGVGSRRWYWEALKQVKRKEQFKAILAEVLEKAGDSNASNPEA